MSAKDPCIKALIPRLIVLGGRLLEGTVGKLETWHWMLFQRTTWWLPTIFNPRI